MLTLTQFLLILITLICREFSWSVNSELSLQPLIAILAYCLGFGLLAKLICINNLKTHARSGLTDSLERTLDRWQVKRQWIESVWVMCLPVALFLTNWGPWISQLELLGFPESLSIMLWFAPSLVHLVLLEVTASQLEVFVRDHAAKHFALDAPRAVSENTFLSIVGIRLRLGGTSSVVTCLLPVLLIAVSADLLRLFDLGWTPSQTSMVAGGIGLSCVALFLPQLLCRWMGVQKLQPGMLRERIEGHCASVGVRVEPMWVASGGRWAGAAVVGWLPGCRQLWLGDALVDKLSDEELDMVVMHELAHLKRRHFLWRLLPVVTACFVGMIVAGLLTSLLAQTAIAEQSDVTAQSIGMLFACVVMLYGLSTGSRHCELDADRQACVLGAQSCQWTHGDAHRAAQCLAQALSKLHRNTPADDQPTWLHPALGRRIADLQLVY